MERLTIRTPKGAALKMNDSYPSELAARADLMERYIIAVERLAAYEDTGLELEEYKRQVDALKRLDIEHMHDLLQAEKEGRLVILPKEDPQCSPVTA